MAGDFVGRSKSERPRLAVLATSYGPNSHAACFSERLVSGMELTDGWHEPRCEVMSLYLMQEAPDDVGLAFAAEHGIRVYPSVATALCEGGDELAVDGVVLIGEHGQFPWNDRRQRLYPRRELFDQVVGVFRQSDCVVPLFIDKHFSWNWAWAQYMWAVARDLDIPLMAGSSLPYATYRPNLVLPDDEQLEHVVSFGYSSDGFIESYGFHALEIAQFVAERRRGGEVGVHSVRCISGADVWRSQADGLCPPNLFDAAIATIRERHGDPRQYTDEVFALDVEYGDGLRATTFLLGGFAREWGYAYLPAGGRCEAASTVLDPPPRRAHFSALTHRLEDMFLSGYPTTPAERTYLTTGVLAYLVESAYRGGAPVVTPDLDVRYAVPDSDGGADHSRR
jgi:hypothetical protein